MSGNIKGKIHLWTVSPIFGSPVHYSLMAFLALLGTVHDRVINAYIMSKVLFMRVASHNRTWCMSMATQTILTHHSQ